MRVVGLMSGTSYDGIDIAAAELELTGSELTLRPLGSTERRHEAEVVELLAAALPPAMVSLEQVCRLDTLLGQAFAEAAVQGIDELAGGRADLVVSHGQTVFHWVSEGRALGTLQLGQPAWIAERSGVPVVSDLRSRDITRGGQGAPLVSMLDTLLLPPRADPRAALNLGGIANLTLIRTGHDSLAYDVGPANAFIDQVVQDRFGEPYDAGGRHAARGTPHAGLLEALLDEPYFELPAPKSTGKELFHRGYLADRLARFPTVGADDLVATVTELTARTVAAECDRHGVRELIVSGGGVRNAWLMDRIGTLAGPKVAIRTIDELGIPADAKEAYAFALLGFLTAYGLPATIPSCTGASAPAVLGSLTPGSAPLRLPEPATVSPTSLRVLT